MKKNIILEIGRIKEMMGLINENDNKIIDEQGVKLALGTTFRGDLVPAGPQDIGFTLTTESGSFRNYVKSIENKLKARKIPVVNKATVQQIIKAIYGQYKDFDFDKQFQTFEERSNKIMEYMDNISKEAWLKSKTENTMFYTYILENNNYYRIWNTLNKSKKENRNIVVDNFETQKKQKTGSQKKADVSALVFEDTSSAGTKFKSGSPELTTDYIQKFNNSFRSVLENALAQAREQQTSTVTYPGNFYISEINIVSSSSKVPQTKLPAPYTTTPTDTRGFLALSTDRAKALKTLVDEFIKNNNIITNDKTIVTVESKGEHGDGTSGPDWDKNKGANHPDYTNAQMAQVTITFAVIPKVETPPEEPETIITSPDGYSLTVSAKTRGGGIIIRIPKIKFNPPQIRGGGPFKTKGGRTAPECPVFD
jgi:hypothetical protein